MKIKSSSSYHIKLLIICLTIALGVMYCSIHCVSPLVFLGVLYWLGFADLPEMVVLPGSCISSPIGWTSFWLMCCATVLTSPHVDIFELFMFSFHGFFCLIMSKSLLSWMVISISLWALFATILFAQLSTCSLIMSVVFYIAFNSLCHCFHFIIYSVYNFFC